MTPAIITDRDGLRVVVDPEGGSSARPAIHVWHANVRLVLDRIDPLCRKDRAQLLDLAVRKADRCGFELDREALERLLEDAGAKMLAARRGIAAEEHEDKNGAESKLAAVADGHRYDRFLG